MCIRDRGYQCYHGQVSQYPPLSRWLSFTKMWSLNAPIILSKNNGNQQYVNDIYSAITSVSVAAKVDARLILAIVMQESTGQADVPCTGNGNCGIMQGPIGTQQLNPADAVHSIKQMVLDGVQGTSQAPGYAQYMGTGLTWVNNLFPGNPYAAARAYNSGNIDPSGNLDTMVWGTKSYSNDIGNRLLGWLNDAPSDPFYANCV